MAEKKSGIRWWIFNKFGPPSVVNLIEEIDKLTEGEQDTIAIYRAGEFFFQIRTSAQETDAQPLMFMTEEERSAFAFGLETGVSAFGGTTSRMSPKGFKTLEDIAESPTHNIVGDKRKLH